MSHDCAIPCGLTVCKNKPISKPINKREKNKDYKEHMLQELLYTEKQ